ncbi:MAG: type II 3-dehydroquinate dehydratase [Proteobacteria bacterium]|nr:type II 3-dehydroquinate dehydratase [Pseudomonadota bacterium]MBU1386454.1 type II 3-dehydroquinate dehydratase [Pseudomonadota bacterium]MBU1544565.1 type II 3-dehydroquinate dehydratase [Pseudomonadota bacterium]MBU2431793.1 type II 3-dehydroquinate dehydratase [Pseudomonadota bacterium]MBU2481224.1 type II 3-dehydroquinate dehydratase [Pseudomonadota bacterium]
MAGTINIQVINGPNLNMLGKREPQIYGADTLDQINAGLEKAAAPMGVALKFFQSNHEGAIVDKIHGLFEDRMDGIIINPGALTHTSVALRDALLLLSCPIVEIHLSNIYKREAFRHKSMIADIATGQISGFGHYGYHMALGAILNIING